MTPERPPAKLGPDLKSSLRCCGDLLVAVTILVSPVLLVDGVSWIVWATFRWFCR